MFLDGIFNNKGMQKILLGKLKDTMVEHKLAGVLVRLDENNEIALTMLDKPGKWVPNDELNTYIDNTLKLLEYEADGHADKHAG